MIDSIALRKLAALNLSPEQMSGILEILAEVSQKEEERLEKQRLRKHRSRDKSVTVTGQERDCHSDAPPFDGPPSCPPHPLKQPPLNTPHTQTQKRARENSGFSGWYAIYPHKIGKGAAEKSYAKAILKATAEELEEGVRRYIRTKPPDREYCNPATWLNQERWKDQPAEIKQNGTHFASNHQDAKPTKDDRARAAVMRAAERLGFAPKPIGGGKPAAGAAAVSGLPGHENLWKGAGEP